MYKPLLLIPIFAFCVIWPTLRQDDQGYSELVKSSEPKEMRAYCQQFREGVSKQMWGEQNCQIASAHSELFFFNQGGEIELLEEMDAILCFVQEERFFRKGEPMQLVRQLKAERACFNYNTQVMTAKDVEMWSYELPGHTVPEKIEEIPFMQGHADAVTVQLTGKNFDIQAQNFQGRML